MKLRKLVRQTIRFLQRKQDWLRPVSKAAHSGLVMLETFLSSSCNMYVCICQKDQELVCPGVTKKILKYIKKVSNAFQKL